MTRGTISMLCFVLLFLRIFSSPNFRLGGTISAYKIVPDEIEEIKVQYYYLSTLNLFAWRIIEMLHKKICVVSCFKTHKEYMTFLYCTV